jgi:hypothetical protein
MKHSKGQRFSLESRVIGWVRALRVRRSKVLAVAVCLACVVITWPPLPVLAQDPPVVRLADLPQLLKDQWRSMATEMNENSRCAAAFDGSFDASRMILKCSIHIRSASEGARRAMRYCEEDRQRLGVRSACRVVQG